MRDDFDILIEVIIDYDEVTEHKECLWYLNRIFKRAFCTRLEILHTIVGHIANGAAYGW